MATSEMTDLLQNSLKEFYKHQLTIPQAAWMGEAMEQPIQEFYVELKLESSNEEVISHNQIFDKMESKRILIEGYPGYGKTTLVTKIAYDWAVNKQYTKRFKLVFLMAIRALQNKSVIESMADLIANSGHNISKESCEKISLEGDTILLILDGLDEVTSNVRDQILKILFRKEMAHTTVVVTCRTGEFNLEPGDTWHLFEGLARKTNFSDQKITVLGVTKKNRAKFLKKFVLQRAEKVDKVVTDFENNLGLFTDLFKSPLMLILLAAMVDSGSVGTISVASMAIFYKDAINFMIRRSEERRQVYLPQSFSVFKPKSQKKKNGPFIIKLTHFGYLCFKKVWATFDPIFEDEENEEHEETLLQNIHKIGLLVVQKNFGNFGNYKTYQTYHRTIMEFMTAYYIWNDFLNNNCTFSRAVEEKLTDDNISFGNTSMIKPFLIELLGEHAHIFTTLISNKNLLRQKLKGLYKQLTLPPAVWIDGGKHLSVREFYVQLKLESSDQIINCSKLFENIKTKRILVEGLPGYGKTTLATKIAYDWGVNEPYTQRFDLVLLVPLCELQSKTILNAIVALANMCGYNNKPEQVREKIKNDEDKILLILDGLDKVQSNKRDEILDILYKRKWGNMTVLITSRSGEFKLDHREYKRLFSGISINNDFSDKCVTVAGISDEDKTVFIKKYFQDKDLTKAKECLQYLSDHDLSFFDSPLLLNILVEPKKPNRLKVTKTNFYKDVVNCTLKRSEERKDIFLSQSFNIFNCKNPEDYHYQDLLKQFGKFYCQRDWRESQEFYDCDGMQKIPELEFLFVEKRVKTTNYCPMIEFMVAYYIWREFVDNNSNFSETSEKILLKDVKSFGENSMVTPFLIGLLKEQASIYFQLMSKHERLFDDHEIALWRMLMECECVRTIKDSLIPVLPTKFHVNTSDCLNSFYSSELHADLVTLGVTSGRVNWIKVIMDIEMSLPKGIDLPLTCGVCC